MSSRTTKEDRAEAIEHLRRVLHNGDTVFCVLANKASSGMSREIKLYQISGNREQWLSGWVSKAMDYAPLGKNEGNVVRGGGMDMGFAIVDSLSHAIGRKLHHRWL
jgi:hypothetical protein